MSVVRDRADARWLPSRFDFALFRLFAYIRLRTAKPEARPGMALAIERHQSTAENYIMTVVVFIVLAAFLASLIAHTLPFGTACALALPAAAVLINVLVVLVGVLIIPIARKLPRRQPEFGLVLNSLVTLAVVIAAAALLSTGLSPLRHVGTAFLILVAANALASICLILMRRSIAEAERGYGVEP